MKKFFDFKVASMLAICALMFAGCAKEQSSMNIEDIPGRAKIIGYLSYDSGQAYMNGEYVQRIQPAANKTVYVRVKNSSLSLKGNADGYTVFQATTDEKGAFSVEIPATDSGVSVEVQPETFTGVYTEFDEMVNGNPQFKSTDVVFEAKAETVTAKTSDTKVVSKHYTSKSIRDIDEFEYTSYLNIKVGEPMSEKITYDGENKVNYKYAMANDRNVIIKVTYSGHTDQNNQTLVKTYGATTSNGVAKFAIPAFDKEWSASIKVSVESYRTDAFYYHYEKEYYDSYAYEYYTVVETEILSGIYKSSAGTSTYSFNPLQPTTDEVKMTFYPNDDQEYEEYSSYSWYGADIEF